ncbi:MAG: ABC transporter ATP-binding protein [Pseudomonadota bacterium]
MRALFRRFEGAHDPFPSSRAGQPPGTLWAFAWHYMREARLPLAMLVGTGALLAVGEVALFGFLGGIVDWLGEADRQTLWADRGGTLLAMGLLVGIGLPSLMLLDSLLMHQTLVGNTPMSARWRMHRYLLGQSVGFFADEMAGRVSTKLMQGALAVREMVMKTVDLFVYVAVYFLAMIALIAASDLRLAAPVVVWLAVYLVLMRVFLPRLSKAAEAQADARSDMTGRIVDSYTNIRTVKLFSHAEREEAFAREGMEDFLQTVHVQMRLVTGLHSLVYLNNCLLILSVAGIGLWLWTQAAIGVGAIAVAIALALRVNGMSQWIMWEVASLFENIGTAFDTMKMMAQPRALEDAPDVGDLVVGPGRVTFDTVRFGYGAAESGPVIDGLTLAIEPGERVGLVGRSGAGKSTLVNLLLRFFDVDAGRIEIDGQDISQVTQTSLRARIGMVTQDTSLLNRSIRDNIAYGRPEATLEEVRAAARKANALEFIDLLEDAKGRKGMDAFVGERGVKLSGGQRQRIAIARIFLKDAPILVLDEATSALDSEVEAAIQDSLFDLMEDKTVLSIAHRLSTLSQLDRIVVMDGGRIVEAGSHPALIAKGGLYADLWARQSGGFIGNDVAAE